MDGERPARKRARIKAGWGQGRRSRVHCPCPLPLLLASAAALPVRPPARPLPCGCGGGVSVLMQEDAMLVREDARVSTLDLVCVHIACTLLTFPNRDNAHGGACRNPDWGVRRCKNSVSTAGLLC